MRHFYSRTTAVFIFFLSLQAIQINPAYSSTEPRRNISIQVEMQSVGVVKTSLHLTSRESNQTQMILVTEGFEAKLSIGKQVPYAVWYRDYLLEEGYITGDIRFVHVGTQLAVKARVIGNQIEVTLTPEISYETKDGSGSIQVTRLATQVMVPNGQSVQIGAVKSKSEFENRFYTRETGEALKVTLTPRIAGVY